MAENKRIIEQVEFYFSDANIVRDEYLKRMIAANEGWAPIEAINSFGKMKEFKKSVTELEAILKESTKLTTENGKIKRNQPIPTYEEHKGEERTLLVRNFPLSYTLEDVQKSLEPHKERIARISLRKNLIKEFKGSAFVELNTKEDVEIMKEAKISVESPAEENEENVKKAKIELEIVGAKEYFDKKRNAKKEEKEQKKKEEVQVIVDSFKDKMFKFHCMKEGEPAKDEEINELKISDLKEEIEGIAFVDIPNRHVRMGNNTEEIKSIEKKGLKIEFKKLTAEETESYCAGLSLTPRTKKFTKKRRN